MSWRGTARMRAEITAALTERGISEEDGPPVSKFTGTDGTEYIYAALTLCTLNYEEVPLLSATILQHFTALEPGSKVYWRAHPEFERERGYVAADGHEFPEKWAAYMRFVNLPKGVVPKMVMA